MAGETDLEHLVTAITEFFTSVYRKKIDELLGVYPKNRSLNVDYTDLERFDPELADTLVHQPDLVLEAAAEAIDTMKLVLPGSVGDFSPHIRVFNVPGSDALIEQISSKSINELVTFKGVVTRRAEVMHKVKVAFYRCQMCEATMRVPVTKNFVEPKRCDSCKKFALKRDEEESRFTDIQRAEVQELLERVRGGAPAAHIELLFEDDLVNYVSPGDNIEVVGIIRIRPPIKTRTKQELVYSRYLDVVSIKGLKRDFEEIEIGKEEEKQLIDLSKHPSINDIIINSIASGIYGHREVKHALSLQLFGGTKGKFLAAGMPIRDDIHVLLIGDPGLAKSRFLQSVSELAPKSIYVSGKSTSGAGLCVAGDSLITLNSKGIHEIGSFVEQNFTNGHEELPNAYACDFSAKVSSLSTQFNSSFENASKIWRIRSPEKLIKIKTSKGKELKITPNTPLLVLGDKQIQWVKSSELKGGESIAVSRYTKPFEGKNIHVISLIKNPNVKISNCHELVTELTNILMKKTGKNLTGLAEQYGLLRDRFYRWRSEKWNQGVSLTLLKRLNEDAGLPIEFLASKIKRGFIRYGKEFDIPELVNSDIAYYSGLIAGDGDIVKTSRGGPRVRLHSADKQLLDNAKEILSKNFNIESKIADDGVRIPNLIVNSELVMDILNQLGIPTGEKSTKVSISNNIISAGPAVVSSFLRGLFDTDGWVSLRSKGSSSIGLCTCSKALALRVLLLLEWWGIRAKIRERKDKVGKKSTINGKLVHSKSAQYYVEISGIDNIRLFSEHIGFTKKIKNETLKTLLLTLSEAVNETDKIPINSFLRYLKAKYKIPGRIFGDNYLYTAQIPSRSKLKKIGELLPNGQDKDILILLANADVSWDSVKEITQIPSDSEWVYDLTVDQSHAFFANGILVHNTVAAEKDELGEGGWTLKAGALVLASGGCAQIDEFDKIEEEDRSALHEAMEGQHISVAKAGIVAKFKTKTAILAAANPKYGRFDQNKNLAEQFEVPPTLLSRFDLIFPIVDVLDEEKDSRLAQHILDAHMGKKRETEQLPIEKDLLRKYIAYARRNVFPQLTPEAIQKIKEFYVDLRRRSKESGSVAITPRYLEGLVRLAEANAKMRLSSVVEETDAVVSTNLMNFVMRQVLTDRVTGAFDADIVATGKSKTEREKLQKVDTIIEVIKDHLKREDTANIEKVVSDAAGFGIDEANARRIISELLRKGEIYEKEHGQIRLVGDGKR